MPNTLCCTGGWVGAKKKKKSGAKRGGEDGQRLVESGHKTKNNQRFTFIFHLMFQKVTILKPAPNIYFFPLFRGVCIRSSEVLWVPKTNGSCFFYAIRIRPLLSQVLNMCKQFLSAY